MKKLIYGTFAVLAMLAMTACGGKTEKSETTVETGQVVETSATPDYDGLNALAAKTTEELTASDYDFLLDQTEIFTDMAIEMGKEDYQKFVENLSEEQMCAIFELGALSSAAKQGKLSDSQLRRFNELREKDPTK